MILKPVIVDNWYNKSEFKRVCKELDFYTDRNKLITQHGNVAVKEGVDQADCYRISIERHFTQEGRKMSDILTLMENLEPKNFMNISIIHVKYIEVLNTLQKIVHL